MADHDGGDCPIQGNPDLYGLGVRLGLYIQLLALTLARPSVKLAFKAINTSTIAFILASFIVLARESASRSLFAPEAYLLFFLLVPQLIVNIMGSNLLSGVIGARGVSSTLLWGAFCYYFSWFWWIGLDVLPMSGCEDEFGFFFTRVSLRGWFRTFNKVIWTISNIAFGMLILIIPFQILFWIYGYRMLRRTAREEHNSSAPAPNSAVLQDRNTSEGDSRVSRPTEGQYPVEQNVFSHIYLQAWTLIPFAVFVSGAEMTIRFNNIQGVNTVNSASQLIPLVLALGLLVHVISKMFIKLSYGYRHAFDINETDDAAESGDNDTDSTRGDIRRQLREERGWLGTIGRFLFRVYCAFVVSYNPDEEDEEPHQLGSAAECPENGRYSAMDIELEGGAPLRA
ncbi:hypothetical protein AAE478_003314 [Parahypoxylon ruwenzoriense]